jgi:hypothetical protein
MQTIDETFIRNNFSVFENFWHRESSDAIFTLTYPAYGYTVRLQTNDERILDAAHLSAPRYPLADPLPSNPQMDLQLSVVSFGSEMPVPEELPTQIQTFSAGDYLFQAATPHLQWFTDLRERRAFAFISHELAAKPRLVSRYILDRATNNIALREGLGQLHATSLVKGERAVIFIAPHGTGKSTTAFHLLNAGYQLMGDALLFIRWHDNRPELMGYPAGEGKLRVEMSLDGIPADPAGLEVRGIPSRDVPQPLFPEWHGGGEEVSVHNVRKHIVNLREIAPQKMIDHSIYPKQIVLCLAERNGGTYAKSARQSNAGQAGQGSTRAELMDADATLLRVLPDTIHVDELEPMARSLESVRRLIACAQCFRLTLGPDPREIVRVIDDL